MDGRPKPPNLVALAAEILTAYVSRHRLPAHDVPVTLRLVHDALRELQVDNGRLPAVPIARSVTPDFLVCLEDGKRLKTLKRHLRAAYGLSPEDYRARWGLPADYPMVAPAYAKRRAQLAREHGLGRRAGRGR
jgi:predicted transcriptional regulator